MIKSGWPKLESEKYLEINLRDRLLERVKWFLKKKERKR